MAVHKIKNLDKLADKFRGKAGSIERAAADTINKSATFAIKESIEAITQEVTLSKSYVKSHIKTVARAKHDNLRAIIAANERGTLLSRFRNTQTSTGFSVAVNRTGGFRNIRNARLMTLRGSGGRVIGLRNMDFVKFLAASGGKGKSTPAKARKYRTALSKALSKPYGMTPLHSRSINQLFTSVREDIQPELGRFMRETFIADFRRYNR